VSSSRGSAVVTGASSGIGRAVAVELARTGFRVAASARRGGALKALVAEGVGDRQIVGHSADLTDPGQAASAAILPGRVDTPMQRRLVEAARAAPQAYRLSRFTSMRGVSMPGDVSRAMLVLLHRPVHEFNGQILRHTSGGWGGCTVTTDHRGGRRPHRCSPTRRSVMARIEGSGALPTGADTSAGSGATARAVHVEERRSVGCGGFPAVAAARADTALRSGFVQ
jgi:hypothetical protein